jgi:hypothetical protein
MLDVNSSFHLDTKYRKQFYLNISSEMSTTKGSAWYDEGSIAEISIEDVTVGSFPFAYRFSGWRGDIESRNATEFLLMDEPKQIHAEWESVEVVQIEKLDPVYKAIINISLLIFAAKIFSGLFARVRLRSLCVRRNYYSRRTINGFKRIRASIRRSRSNPSSFYCRIRGQFWSI